MQNANDFSLFKLQTEYLRTYYIYNKFYTIKGSKQQPVNSLKTIFLKTLNIQNHSKSMRWVRFSKIIATAAISYLSYLSNSNQCVGLR